MESIVLGSEVNYIAERAFAGCSKLTEIHIPASVKNIGDYAFHTAISLTKVSGCEGIVAIGNGAFSGGRDPWNNIIANSITDISLPNCLESIGSYAFAYNFSLTELHIPNSVSVIGEGAFSSMPSLKTLTLSNSITSIPNYLCSGCGQLQEIIIPESIVSIGDNAFEYCGLDNVVIGNNVESIGACAFSRCEYLANIVIPDATSVIEEYAFGACFSPKKIIIGSGMTKIKPNVFSEVEPDILECQAMVPPTVFSETFSDWQYENTTLIVPDESIESYKKKTHWKKFIHLEGADVDEINATSNTEIARYNINGCKVEDEYKGIIIVKYSDGSINKKIIR